MAKQRMFSCDICGYISGNYVMLSHFRHTHPLHYPSFTPITNIAYDDGCPIPEIVSHSKKISRCSLYAICERNDKDSYPECKGVNHEIQEI